MMASATAVCAQASGTVFGKILEGSGSKPVSGALISVVGTGLSVLSGSQGWYFITGIPPGDFVISVSRMSYGTLTDTLRVGPEGPLRLDVRLQAEPIPLSGLTVSRDSAKARSPALGHRTVIGREELAKRHAGTTSELLQALVPGLAQVRTSGQVGSEPQLRMRGIRSLEYAVPLFFVDGVRVGSARMPGPEGTAGVLSFINTIIPADIERIEIVRNPDATFLYGADARGGAILIFTRQGGAPPALRQRISCPVIRKEVE